MARKTLQPNKKLKAAIETFLSLLYHYDCGTKRSFYGYHYWRKEEYRWWAGTKYIHIMAPAAYLVVLEDGSVYRKIGYRRPNWNAPLGSIYDLLHKKSWGQRIKRETVQVWTYSSGKISQLRLVANAGDRCTVCGRREGVKKTLNGDLCQYHRGADSRHMNVVRQLGGVPHHHGRHLVTNDDYLVD